MTKETPFSRVAARLRGASTIAYQAAQGEIANTRATHHQPAGIREIAKRLKESGEILENYATEQEVSQGHRQESAEAYMVLAQSLANAATILGTDGQNIKIILFADSDFIFEVLTEGQPEALEKAFSELSPELGERYVRWMGGKMK